MKGREGYNFMYLYSAWVCPANVTKTGSDIRRRFRQRLALPLPLQRAEPRIKRDQHRSHTTLAQCALVQAGDSCAMLQTRSKVDQPDLSVRMMVASV